MCIRDRAQRELPREPHHDVPRLADVSEVEGQRRDREQVAVGHERKDEDPHADERDHHLAAPSGLGRVRRAHRGRLAHIGHLRPPPMRPCGRASRRRTSRPKLAMLFADGAISTPASASETPITTPPRSAPTIEPRPPTITMTNASRVYE